MPPFNTQNAKAGVAGMPLRIESNASVMHAVIPCPAGFPIV
jgi:hypothetical protein